MQPQSTGSVSEDRAASRAQRAAGPPSEGRRVTPQPRLLEFRLPAVPQAWVPLPVAWLRARSSNGCVAGLRKHEGEPPGLGRLRSSLRRTPASKGCSRGKPDRATEDRRSGPCSSPAPTSREISHRPSVPFPPSLPPLGSVRSSRYGCAAEAPVAAASAVADARPSAALPLAVGTACGDCSGDVGPALLLPGGGRGGRSGGSGVAAAALG